MNNVITAEQAAEIYRYCILEDEFDFDAAAPDYSPHYVTFTLRHHEDDLYQPTDGQIYPALLEVIHEALGAFPDAFAAVRAALDQLRADLRGYTFQPT